MELTNNVYVMRLPEYITQKSQSKTAQTKTGKKTATINAHILHAEYG